MRRRRRSHVPQARRTASRNSPNERLLPGFAVGFGVRTAEHARAIAAGADGVVVGSALVDALCQSLDKDNKAGSGTVKAVTTLLSSLAEGLRSARRVAAE